MQTASANGIDLAWDAFGDRNNPALILVMGFGAQMTAWPEGFCELLADAGFYVVRFDNRDIGLSQKSDGPPPDAMALFARAVGGEDVSADAPYSLSTMAADVIGLMDALGINRAHVAGASMGGMIVQHLAIEHADRLRSVTSIMSTTGNPEVGQADEAAMTALLTPPPEGPDEAIIEHSVGISRELGGPLWSEDVARERAAAAYHRSHNPEGSAFQLAAIAASGDRSERLTGVDVPFLVIHGRADPLITVSGGLATAELVPGADLVVYADMGHDMPEPLWPRFVADIAGHARAAG